MRIIGTIFAVLLIVGLLVGLFIWPGWLIGRALWDTPRDQNTALAPTWTPVPPVNPIAPPIEQPVAPAPAAAPATQPDGNNWPTDATQAAALFGGEASRWEVSAEGGWHLREENTRTVINPAGGSMEGYYDTAPGKDPRQFVSVAAMEVQGCTIWQATPEELFCAMMAQKRVSANDIDTVGFQKPTCP